MPKNRTRSHLFGYIEHLLELIRHVATSNGKRITKFHYRFYFIVDMLLLPSCFTLNCFFGAAQFYYISWSAIVCMRRCACALCRCLHVYLCWLGFILSTHCCLFSRFFRFFPILCSAIFNVFLMFIPQRLSDKCCYLAGARHLFAFTLLTGRNAREHQMLAQKWKTTLNSFVHSVMFLGRSFAQLSIFRPLCHPDLMSFVHYLVSVLRADFE